MNAEDTFRILRRLPFSEMNKIINQSLWNATSDVKLLEPKSVILARYGWTTAEYAREWGERYGHWSADAEL